LALPWSCKLAFQDQYEAAQEIIHDRDHQIGRVAYWSQQEMARKSEINGPNGYFATIANLKSQLATKPKEIIKYIERPVAYASGDGRLAVEEVA
jgi:hypothetical protein